MSILRISKTLVLILVRKQISQFLPTTSWKQQLNVNQTLSVLLKPMLVKILSSKSQKLTQPWRNININVNLDIKTKKFYYLWMVLSTYVSNKIMSVPNLKLYLFINISYIINNLIDNLNNSMSITLTISNINLIFNWLKLFWCVLKLLASRINDTFNLILDNLT